MTNEEIKKLARLAKLPVPENDYTKLAVDLGKIVEYVKQLQEIKLPRQKRTLRRLYKETLGNWVWRNNHFWRHVRPYWWRFKRIYWPRLTRKIWYNGPH